MKNRIEEMNPRYFMNGFVVLHGPSQEVDMCKGIFNFRPEDDAILTYCYVDHEAGTTFQVLSPCFIDGNSINVGDAETDTAFKIRYQDDFIITAVDYMLDFYQFNDTVKIIKECYECTDEVEAIRQYTLIDELRYQGNPDDVLVTFIAPDTKSESMWVRLEHIVDGKLVGHLLNSPYSKNFGVGYGDNISMILLNDDEKGKTLLAETEYIKSLK